MLQGIFRLAVWAAAGLFAGTAIPDLARAQASCGPGNHWVDGCGPAGGSDFFPTSGAVVGIDVNLDCVKDQNIILSGPTTVQRQGASDASANFPGAFGSSTDSHIDVIDTEIVSMSLGGGGGYTLTAGLGLTPGGVNLNPSKGTIVEKAINNTLADSFFDVFFEVALPGGTLFLYNQSAVTVTAVIDRVKPQTVYLHPAGCVALFTQQVGGTHVANLIDAQHHTVGLSIPAMSLRGLFAFSVMLLIAMFLALRRRVDPSSGRA